MEFTCERGNLYDVLSNVQSVIPGRSTHPVLMNVLISASGDKVSIMGTDMDVSMVGELEAKVIKDGEYALPAKKLFELLREFAPGEVHIKREKNRVEISQGAGRFYVSGVERVDYPAEDIMKDETVDFNLSVEDIKRIVTKTSFAISADVARIALSGLFLKITKGKLIAVATDGHRLTLIKKDVKVEIDGDVEKEIILPAKSVGHFIKMIGDAEGDVFVKLGNGTARFEVGNLTLTTKLITERFPDYENVLPRDNDKAMIADGSLLISAIKRASVLSNPLTHLVKMSIGGNKMALSCTDYDVGGEAYEEIPIEFSSEPINIGFNSNYILEVLRHLETDEVKFLLKNSLSATLIVPLPQKEGEEYLSILMPLRLPEEED